MRRPHSLAGINGISGCLSSAVQLLDWVTLKRAMTVLFARTNIEAWDVRATLDRHLACASDRGDLSVGRRRSIVDTATDTVVATVPVAFAPAGLAADRTGRSLFVTHPDRGEISVIDVAERRVIRALGIGGSPCGIALGQLPTQKVARFPEDLVVEPGGNKAYIANWFSGDVLVIDIGSGKELKRLKTGGGHARWPWSPAALQHAAVRETDG